MLEIKNNVNFTFLIRVDKVDDDASETRSAFFRKLREDMKLRIYDWDIVADTTHTKTYRLVTDFKKKSPLEMRVTNDQIKEFIGSYEGVKHVKDVD